MAAQPAVATTTVEASGGNQPFPLIQPSLRMNYVICLYGIHPSRS